MTETAMFINCLSLFQVVSAYLEFFELQSKLMFTLEPNICEHKNTIFFY